MKALVYHGPGKRSWEEVTEPQLIDPTDVIARVDTTTICGTDLHILKGDVPEVKPAESWVTKQSAPSPRLAPPSPTSRWATASSFPQSQAVASAPTVRQTSSPTASPTPAVSAGFSAT